jgi:tripartite-type tricarboxylate transporter receptor subunit TctC
MKTPRLFVVVIALVALCMTGAAHAQTYPSRVVRYIVTDAAGSGTDLLARIVAEGLTEVFGHQVIVDNRPGAGGNIGAELGARANADGYTLVQVATTHAVNATLYKNLGYNLTRDLTGVSQLAGGPSVVVVSSNAPAKTVADFVAAAKAKPGALTYGSAGTGTCSFLAGELFRRQAALNMMHVPYKGGPPAVTAAVSGEISVYFSPMSAALPMVRQGRLHALAVSTPKRLDQLPNVPTVAEAGLPGYQFTCWYGLMAPAATPPKVVAAVHAAVVKVLANPNAQKRLADLGFIAVGDKPEEFTAHVKAQVEALRPIVRELPSPQ